MFFSKEMNNFHQMPNPEGNLYHRYHLSLLASGKREDFFDLPAKQIITGKAILIPEIHFDRGLGRWKEK